MFCPYRATGINNPEFRSNKTNKKSQNFGLFTLSWKAASSLSSVSVVFLRLHSPGHCRHVCDGPALALCRRGLGHHQSAGLSAKPSARPTSCASFCRLLCLRYNPVLLAVLSLADGLPSILDHTRSASCCSESSLGDHVPMAQSHMLCQASACGCAFDLCSAVAETNVLYGRTSVLPATLRACTKAVHAKNDKESNAQEQKPTLQ